MRAKIIRRVVGWLASSSVLLAASLVPAATASAAGPTLTGTGSSYAAVAINQWVAQMDQFFGVNINYQTTSSVIGLNNYAQGQVDFGASEIGYSTGQADQTPPSGSGYQYMPTVAGATCLMFNLTSATQQPIRNLNLTTAAMLGIFTGTIKHWNDPEIASANPGILLPSSPVTVVYRTDASGENYLFSDYFAILDEAGWNDFASALSVSPGPTAIWPTPANSVSVGKYSFAGWVGQSGSDNASNYVAATPQSITFVETAYAILHNSPCAAVQNISGAFVQPSSKGDAIALTHDQVFLTPGDPRYGEQDLAGVYTAPEADAYPISAYSYLVTPTSGISAEKGKILGQFITFIACRGQQAAGQLGYSPIPPNLIQVDFEAIKRLNGADPPPAIDGAHCPNPYLTGELQIPAGGGPVIVSSDGSGGTSTAVSQADSNAKAAAIAAAAAKAGKSGAKVVTIPGAKGLATAGGQAPGLALNAAVTALRGISSPAGVMVAGAIAFLALLAAPPGMAALRTRRLSRRGDEGEPLSDDVEDGS